MQIDDRARCTECHDDEKFFRKEKKKLESLTPTEIEDLKVRIDLCYARIKGRGIKSSPVHDVRVENGTIIILSKNSGTDIKYLIEKIKMSEQSTDELFEKYVLGMTVGSLPFFQRVFLQEDGFFDVGFDSHSKNWCINTQGEFVFVDFTKGRVFYKGVYWVGDIQPKDEKDVEVGRQRYFTPEGNFRRLLFDVDRLIEGKTREGRRIILQAIKEKDPDCAQWAQGLIESLPSSQILEESDLRCRKELYRKLIGELIPPDDVDDLRDLAVVAVLSFSQPYKFLDEIIDISHASYKKPRLEREEKFKQARERLLAVCV